ncbi:hypothetical protein EC957_008985 [Mortierella hygrophila]|uniref:DUF1212-domain-containing protein n=1 Tax=Mortierella hygrophila TaxID=979708 RepID=A0A9P6FC99_9FUNG|nr:hypothetical protein EC957_008985 [Mortierella hygrophila]
MSSNNNSPNNTPPRDSRSSSNASSSLAINTTIVVPPSIAINPSSSSNTSTSNTTRTPPSIPASSKSNNTNTNTNNNPRYNPPVPSRMSGTYSSNNSIYKLGGDSSVHRLAGGTRSANSSPPSTPPNGLRDYYINAALQRSGHHRLHPGSLPSSSSNLQQQQQQTRPSISILVPQPQSQNTLVPEATVARRSYSADHLTINEPEITVTTPGGSNATEEHVMTLEAALNNLIEKESRGNTAPGTPENEEGSVESDEPIMMRGSIPESSSKRDSSNKWSKGFSAFNSNSNSHSNSGISLTPKVLANRFETEGTTTAAQDLNDNKEKRLSDKDKEKKKKNRISKLFHREGSSTPVAVPEDQYDMRYIRPPVQPSKAGVLSNLLKLQGKQTHEKAHTHREHKPRKEKKKRPALYTRSANNSATDLSKRSFLSTYPPLPNINNNNQGSTTGMGSLSKATNRNSNNNNGTNNNHRQSFQFDGTMTPSFAAGHSPMHSPMQSPLQSPNGSPRESFSYENNYNMSTSTTLHSLSAEEKMRITLAVADILQRQDYVLRLARAMIRYGAPSHRLEDAVDHTARTLELNLQCVYMPNVMIVAFTDYETHTSETHLLKVSAGLDMYKFAQVHQILKMVTHSAMPVEEAIMKLDAINTEKDLWPRWLVILSYALASFCTAPMFFKGNWIDAGVSFLIGGTVGMMAWLSEKVPSYAHICEITMSVVVAFVAEALHNYVCRSSVKWAGIVILLPGYTITCSILELSSRHMISGSVRLFYAIIFSLLLGYGLTIGASLWNLFDRSSSTESVPAVCPDSLDPKWNILFVPIFAFTLNIWLKAHPRQWVLATILSILGYVVSYSTSTWADAETEVSSALASFAIGLCGNLYQRATHQLSFQAVVCAVFFLVPGSLGLKGAMALFTDDTAGGVNFALQMVITAIAISVGLFASALVVYPMGKARSAQMTF